MKKIYIKIKKEKSCTVYKYLECLYGTYAFPITYHDLKYKNIHCSAGKNRSFDDIYEILLSKFHNLSRKKYYKVLNDFITNYTNKGGRKCLMILYCPKIHKWVIMYINGIENYVTVKNPLVYDYCDSLKKLNHSGDGTITGNDILNA